VASSMTPERRAFLRRLERADAGADSTAARNALIADGQVVQPARHTQNAKENVAAGRIWNATPKQVANAVDSLAGRMTTRNPKPTPNGARALAAAAARSPLARRAQGKK
jgi:hypothetical protein